MVKAVLVSCDGDRFQGGPCCESKSLLSYEGVVFWFAYSVKRKKYVATIPSLRSLVLIPLRFVVICKCQVFLI